MMTFEEGLQIIDRSYVSFRDNNRAIGGGTDYVKLYPFLFHLYRNSSLDKLDVDLTYEEHSDDKSLSTICDTLSEDLTLDEKFELYDSIEPTLKYILRNIPAEWFDSHYIQAFDHVLRRVTKDSKNLYMQPDEVTDFVCSLCNFINDDKGYETIYNPFAGLGSYIIGGKIRRESIDTIHSIDGKVISTTEDTLAIGQELDAKTWALAHIRDIVYGKSRNYIYNADSLLWTYEDSDDGWNGFLDNEAFQNDSVPCGNFRITHDLIVSTPPFGVAVPKNRQYVYKNGRVYAEDEQHPLSVEDFTIASDSSMHDNIERPDYFPYPNITVEEEFIRRGLVSLCETGKLVGLFSYGIINSTSVSCRDIKQKAIEEDLLEYVISLPSGLMPETSIATAVLVFNRKKRCAGKICFVDGSDFISENENHRILDNSGLISALKKGEKKIVCTIPNEVVLKNECRLNPLFYLWESNLNVPDGYDRITVGDICDIIPGNRIPDAIKSVRVVRIKDLSEGIHEWYMDENTLSIDNTDRNFRQISEPVILVPKFVSSTKPTYVKASEDVPVYVAPNLLKLRPNSSSIDISFLVYALQNRMSIYNRGYVSISKNELLRSSISVPKSLSAQKEIVKNAILQSLSIRKKDSGLEAAIDAQKKDYYDNLHRRKHDLCNYIGPIRNNVTAIQKFVDKHPYKDDVISAKLGITLSAYVHRLMELVDKMSVQLEHLADEETFGKADSLDIYEALNKINGGSQYDIDFIPDISSLSNDDLGENLTAITSMAHEDFDRLVGNIITNATRHGFTDPNRRYTIRITLSWSMEDNQYIIKFYNNGIPMPKGIDTRRYGIKGECAGSNKGSGLGGSVVKTIVEHYNGSYDVSNNPDEEFSVCITIKLPRYE